jgi:hypothetical protein
MLESGYYVLLLGSYGWLEAAPGLLSWGGKTFEGVVVSLFPWMFLGSNLQICRSQTKWHRQCYVQIVSIDCASCSLWILYCFLCNVCGHSMFLYCLITDIALHLVRSIDHLMLGTSIIFLFVALTIPQKLLFVSLSTRVNHLPLSDLPMAQRNKLFHKTGGLTTYTWTLQDNLTNYHDFVNTILLKFLPWLSGTLLLATMNVWGE